MVLLAFHVGMNVADADPGDGAVWRHAIPENSRQVATSAFAACRRLFVVPLSGREKACRAVPAPWPQPAAVDAPHDPDDFLAVVRDEMIPLVL